LGVFFIREIEERHATDNADARGSDIVLDRQRTYYFLLPYPIECEDERNERSSDRRGARAAIRLNDVAVDPHRPLAQIAEAHNGAHRPADETLNLHRPSANLALRCLTRRPGGGGAREHPILRRHPSLPGAAKKRRHAFFDACSADDAGSADFDQYGSFRMKQVIRSDRRWSELVGGTVMLSHGRMKDSFFRNGRRKST
jgi:hypothetical protein